jgi:hypothetical protein
MYPLPPAPSPKPYFFFGELNVERRLGHVKYHLDRVLIAVAYNEDALAHDLEELEPRNRRLLTHVDQALADLAEVEPPPLRFAGRMGPIPLGGRLQKTKQSELASKKEQKQKEPWRGDGGERHRRRRRRRWMLPPMRHSNWPAATWTSPR